MDSRDQEPNLHPAGAIEYLQKKEWTWPLEPHLQWNGVLYGPDAKSFWFYKYTKPDS